MRMFAHIFKTWALAQLLHPLLLLVYFGFLDPTETGFWIGVIFFIFFFSVFASIPSFLISWLLLYVISNAELTQGEQLIAWVVSVVAAILVNFILLSLTMDGVINEETIKIIPPSLIAAVLSIIIRGRSFFKFQSNYKTDSL